MLGCTQRFTASMRPANQGGCRRFIPCWERRRNPVPDDAGDGLGLDAISSLGWDRIDAPGDSRLAQLSGSGHQLPWSMDALTVARDNDHNVADWLATPLILLPLLRRSCVDDAHLVAYRLASDLHLPLFHSLNDHDPTLCPNFS
jgi:hypothetical protein